MVTNDAYINADAICALLDKIRATFCDGLPVTIVLDNARYQRCRRVMAHAAALALELFFLTAIKNNPTCVT